MPDARVIHFWDGELKVGQWFAEEIEGEEGIAWDTYSLYGSDAVWNTIPQPLVSSGRTIYAERETLEMKIRTLFGE